MRQALSERKLEWERATFVDYPSRRYWRDIPRIVAQTPVRYLSINNIALRLIEQHNLTHIHLSNPFQAATFRLAIEKSRIATIYRCGDLPIVHNTFYRRIWAWLLKRSDFIVAESEFIRGELLALGANPTRTRLIRTPAPRRTPSSVFDSSVVRRHNPGTSFVYVGQFSEHKGISLLLEAFALVSTEESRAHLFIAAPIVEEYAKRIVREQAGLPSSRNIHFLGSVEDVPGLLRQCDVHVAPTLKAEPYGLVAVEAKEAGIPSIVFARGGLAELVAHNTEGLALSEATPESLGAAMLTYCRQPGVVKKHGAQARISLSNRLNIHQHDQLWWSTFIETAAKA